MPDDVSCTLVDLFSLDVVPFCTPETDNCTPCTPETGSSEGSYVAAASFSLTVVSACMPDRVECTPDTLVCTPESNSALSCVVVVVRAGLLLSIGCMPDGVGSTSIELDSFFEGVAVFLAGTQGRTRAGGDVIVVCALCLVLEGLLREGT